MKEQIRRILGLVAAGKLAPDDAAPLLEALSSRLSLSDDARTHLFGLLHAEEFGVDRVTELLLARVQPQAPRPPEPPRPPVWGGLDDLGQSVGAAVEEAIGGLRGGFGRQNRPGSILRIETEDENGNSYSANLPLSLAEHAAKLIPPQAIAALERSGVTLEGLTLLLQAGPQPGPLLEAEDEHGNQVALSVR
ncbi:hypothetical protein [Deinococcus sonorensis]|uniref:Uncharacterized protein n=2 Tax=Deinococcus sonorensis TaxID=309891 RepID=A0AAU7UDQ6_9DEIO